MTLPFETRLNIALSELLSIAGVRSRPEQSGVGRKDVLIHYQGLRIVLEGSYDRLDAARDANRRIDQLQADIAIAVHYTLTLAQDISEQELRQKLRQSFFAVLIIIPDDISGTIWELLNKKKVVAQSYGEWINADIEILTTIIKEVSQILVDETALLEIEQKVEALVADVVGQLHGHSQSDEIAQKIYDTLYNLYGFSIGNPVQIKEPLFAQATLAILLGTVYYESIRVTYSLPSVRELEGRLGSREGVEEAVRRILNINYELIFDLEKALLTALPAMETLFAKMLNIVSEIRTKRALLRRDLGGKVYHKIVGSWALRKGLATYYTQVPAAFFLLHLAKPSLCKVADFSCGSGTLLIAAYSAMNMDYRLALWKANADRSPYEIERTFHRQFIANCYAFDVLQYALQITFLNLALHSSETPIDGIIPSQVIPLGFREEDNFVSLGSLELARPNPRFDKISAGALQLATRGSRMISLMEVQKSAPYDFIVMNPPFTRTTGRGGKEGSGLFGFMSNLSERNAVLKDYNALRDHIHERLLTTAAEILQGSSLEAILEDSEFKMFRQIWQAGEGLPFLYLADTQIAKDGTICFVLPRGLLSGVSWFLARTLLLNNYHIEYIMVSYEPNAYNFSESSVFAECMFIARRREPTKCKESTKFVMFLKKPPTSFEAAAFAIAVASAKDKYVKSAGGRAFVREVSYSALRDNLDNWGRFVCLPDVNLLDRIDKLLDGKIIINNSSMDIPLTKLNNLIATIGVDRRRFGDTFHMINVKVPGYFPMIQGGEELIRLRMSISPNGYLLPKEWAGRRIFHRMGGYLFMPNRIRVTTAHSLAMLADEKCLANIFYSVKLKNETKERNKALCLWLNTTWGLLSILSGREETHGGWIELVMTQWRMLPVLDLDKIGEDKVRELASVYDEFRYKELARISNQYQTNRHVDEVRLALDAAFLEVFGLKITCEELIEFYRPIGQALDQWLGEATSVGAQTHLIE